MAGEVIKGSTRRYGIVLDQARVVAELDRVADGALGRFKAIATESLQTIVADARARWPVAKRYSKRSVDKFEIYDRLDEKGYTVAARNTADYAYYVRFTVKTLASIQDEAESWAGGPDRFKSEKGWLAREFYRAEGRKATADEFADVRYRYWLRRLTRRFSGDAPPGLAGKSANVELLRKPWRAAAPAVVERLQVDFQRWARGGSR